VLFGGVEKYKNNAVFDERKAINWAAFQIRRELPNFLLRNV
jgi:hypothetical protein